MFRVVQVVFTPMISRYSTEYPAMVCLHLMVGRCFLELRTSTGADTKRKFGRFALAKKGRAGNRILRNSTCSSRRGCFMVWPQENMAQGCTGPVSRFTPLPQSQRRHHLHHSFADRCEEQVPKEHPVSRMVETWTSQPHLKKIDHAVKKHRRFLGRFRRGFSNPRFV